MKAFLGQWIFIKKACDEIFDAIRAAHPDLPGWAPIQGEKPIELATRFEWSGDG